MTEPQPYPGDLPAEERPAAPVGRVTLTRTYRDLLGRDLIGYVVIRGADDQSVEIQLRNGELVVDLPVGRYRLLAILSDSDGKPSYQSEAVTL